MLRPQKTKFQKAHRNTKKNGFALTNNPSNLNFGNIGLKSKNYGHLNSKQIDSFKSTIQKNAKKKGKFYLNCFFDTPISKKPAETRMGKGKGPISQWVAKIKPGTVFLELKFKQGALSTKLISKIKSKIPISSQIVRKNTYT